MGRRVFVDIPESVHKDGESGTTYKVQAHTYDVRVLSFKQFLPATQEVGRTKHLVQIWTDPGGMRTLSVGSIHLKDPRKVAAGKAAADRLNA